MRDAPSLEIDRYQGRDPIAIGVLPSSQNFPASSTTNSPPVSVLGLGLIRGMFKPEAVEEGHAQQFTTVPVPDAELVPLLQAQGVTFSGQSTNPVLQLLLAWVLPAVVVVGIWALV